jgi:PEP-CTERM motif
MQAMNVGLVDLSVVERAKASLLGRFGGFLAGLVAIAILTTRPAVAAEIWDGPTLSFTNFTSSDVDRITPSVWITRGSSRGIYNPVVEVGYSHSLSPIGTEWAYGELTNYASLVYNNWEGWFGGAAGGGPPSTVGKDAVLHIIPEDIYLSVRFTSWNQRSGGFSYDRSTSPLVPEPSSALMTLMGFGVFAVLRRRRWIEKPLTGSKTG